MTTLIAVYNSDGCIGRCDAKCHNAVHPRCICVCGGKNHGIGLKEAPPNTWEISKEDIEEWIKGVDPEGTGHRIVRQQLLFVVE